MDIHSGGGQKLDWAYIFIEAPEREAAIIFQNRFGRNPHRVTCTCCGKDYSLTESSDLAQATAFERGCDSEYTDEQGNVYSDDDWYKLPIEKRRTLKFRYVERAATKYHWRSYKTLDEYLKSTEVLVIPSSEIKPEERSGELHEEGYVWRE